MHFYTLKQCQLKDWHGQCIIRITEMSVYIEMLFPSTTKRSIYCCGNRIIFGKQSEQYQNVGITLL